MFKTEITTDIARCAKVIRDGGIVAFATETVYGLGADCFNSSAVQAIFNAKGRPGDNPLIVHVHSIDQAKELVRGWDEVADRLAQAFWPGPFSMVFPKAEGIPDVVTGGKDTVAIRMPGKALARDFIEACACPIAAPSANTSTRPSPTCAAHVLHDMDGKIPYILDGGDCDKGIESTVFDVASKTILRPGSVTKEEIEQEIGTVHAAIGGSDTPRAPGMKYPHYRPAYKVVLIKGKHVENKLKELYNLASTQGERCVILDVGNVMPDFDGNLISFGGDEALCAEHLYGTLIGQEGKIDIMLVAATDTQGVGFALMNRLEKAAAGNIIIS